MLTLSNNDQPNRKIAPTTENVCPIDEIQEYHMAPQQSVESLDGHRNVNGKLNMSGLNSDTKMVESAYTQQVTTSKANDSYI